MENHLSWRGDHLAVEVPYTHAGVSQSVWIESELGAILIDVGDGLLRDLLARDLHTGRIRGLFFTHGHYDHMGGLHSLLGFLRMTGRTQKLPIHWPEGCHEVRSTVDTFERSYPDTIPFRIARHELAAGDVVEVAGMGVRAYPVLHCGSIEGKGILDPIPALGYRVTCEGESVAVTGDTGDCPGVRELVAGADLALVEATFQDDGVGEQMLEKVHLSEDRAREIGRLAKEHFLVHRGARG